MNTECFVQTGVATTLYLDLFDSSYQILFLIALKLTILSLFRQVKKKYFTGQRHMTFKSTVVELHAFIMSCFSSNNSCNRSRLANIFLALLQENIDL